jgi:hypothetical protein
MKRFFLYFLCTVIGSIAANADKVSEQQALQQALQFMPGKHFSSVKAADKSFARSDSDQESFYIFNAADKGYVIVSADDRTVPILGYSTSGTVDLDNMPDNLRYWLNCYAEQINGLGKTFQPERSSMTRADKPAIDPLITTTWDQGEPYNLQCPMDGVYRSVTGCVATALAQAMYYYKWPASSPALPAYSTYTKSIAVSALPATTFKWDLMKDSYNYGETGAASDAVAELMRYCGQIFQMDYTSDYGSAAYLSPETVAQYFNYSSEMQEIYRYYFSTSQWEELIYNELTAGRPVLYSGSSTSGGHQFICDGYDGSGLFHFNWGWGGFSDGFFVLSLANPDDKGIGGGSSSDGYTISQSAVIGFKPAEEGEVFHPNIYSMVHWIDIPMAYTRPSVAEDFENVELADYVSVYVDLQTSLSFEAGWGFWQNGTITCLASHECVIPVSEWYQENSVKVSFGADLPDGEYRLYQLYRMPGETEWHLCSSWESQYVIATISGTDLKLSYPSYEEEVTINDISFIDPVVKKPINVTVNLTNTGTTMQETLFLWLKQNGSWQQVSLATGSVEPGQTGDVIMSFVTDKNGTFAVKITSDEKGENVLGTSSVTVADLKEVTVGGLKYAYNSLNFEAMVINDDSYSTLEGNLIIPGSITLTNGQVCQVTAIDDWALFNTFMSSVTIQEGVKSIGDHAFQYCFEMKKLELPSTLEHIGEHAFGSCGTLQEVVCYVKTPFDINSNVFEVEDYEQGGVNPPTATLYVPFGAKLKYQAAAGWKVFSKIAEMDAPEIETEPITIGKNGKTTFCGDKGLDFSGTDEVKAFIATGFDKAEGTIWMTRVKDVPAGVPVMIKGDANMTYNIPVTDGGTSYYKNMFVGNTSGETVSISETSEDGKYVNYYMSGGQFKSVTVSANIGNNKCYLQLPAEFEAETTGEALQVKIASSGKSSFAAPYDLDFTDFGDDLKAFTATGFDKSTSTIWLTRVKKVQKGEGLLLKGTGGETYTIPSTGIQSSYVNMIVGNISGETLEIGETAEDGALTNYYLSGGTYVSVKVSANIGNNKSYLQLPTSMLAGARSEEASDKQSEYGFVELETEPMPLILAETTGIESMENEQSFLDKASDEWYSLSGQRIVKPTKKGLYIHNGKKVVIK